MVLKADTRQKILDTASRLFHTQSYGGVGIATICEQAGVSKGSFFHFFRSKQELTVAVIEQFREKINNLLIEKAFSSTRPPLERLDRFVKELYEFQKAQVNEGGHVPGCPFGNLAVEQATRDEVLRQKAEGCLGWLAGHFRSAISDAIESGAFPPVDEDATADAMLSYIEGIQLLAKTRNDPEVILRLGPALKSIRVPKEV